MFQIRLKELREVHNLSQAKLAAALGVRQSTVAMWENGKNKPEFGTLTRIAEFFNVSVDNLVGTAENKKAPAPQGQESRSEMEAQLLEMFARLTPENKQAVAAVIKAMLSDNKE